MILSKVLEYDLHRSRVPGAIPQFVHMPAPPSFLPALISNSRGKFVVTRQLYFGNNDRYFIPKNGSPEIRNGHGLVLDAPTDEKQLQQLYLVSAVFSHDSDRIDDVVPDMFDAAYDLSVEDGMPNVFSGPKCAMKAFSYVQKSSGMKIQPHVCLVPESWSPDEVSAFFGDGYDPEKRRFHKYCRSIGSKVRRPVFLSRPDMVGLYTQFMGGGASIVLSNVRLGMAFCL
jgi:hypothetical protein